MHEHYGFSLKFLNKPRGLVVNLDCSVSCIHVHVILVWNKKTSLMTVQQLRGEQMKGTFSLFSNLPAPSPPLPHPPLKKRKEKEE